MGLSSLRSGVYCRLPGLSLLRSGVDRSFLGFGKALGVGEHQFDAVLLSKPEVSSPVFRPAGGRALPAGEPPQACTAASRAFARPLALASINLILFS